MEYEVIRSNRKTLAVQIHGDRVLVRAPARATNEDIQRFLMEHIDWIEKHLAKAKQQAATALPKLTMEDIRRLADQALAVIPLRVRYYAPLVGVTYGRITIRNQKTRWGSCSARGNLNFNCLLMLAPPEVLDYVIVHELCHRKEMNHSDRFYVEVLRVFPDYHKWDKWLKENGPILMGLMPE